MKIRAIWRGNSNKNNEIKLMNPKIEDAMIHTTISPMMFSHFDEFPDNFIFYPAIYLNSLQIFPFYRTNSEKETRRRVIFGTG